MWEAPRIFTGAETTNADGFVAHLPLAAVRRYDYQLRVRSYDIRASLWADLLFAAGAMLALLVLAGWGLNIPQLRDFGVGRYPDWPVTAASNLALSLALLSIDRIVEPLRRLLLAVPICVAIISVAEYLTGLSSGLDQLLFPAALHAFSLPHPGRPGMIPSLSLLVMGCAAWRANAVRREGGTILFLLGCGMTGVAAMSLSLVLLLGEAGLSQQPIRLAGSLPVSLTLATQAGGLLVWLIQHQRGLPWSRGRGMRPVNLVLVAILVLPAILLPIQLKIAELELLGQLPTEILASAFNVLMVVGLLGWAIERLAREQRALEQREKALEAGQAQLQSILETVPDAMVVIDEEGLIRTFSAAAERLFGYRRDEVVGRNVSILMPAPYAEQHRHFLDHYRRTGERRIIGHIRILRARRADGTEIPIELSVGEARIGGMRIFTGFIRDISDRIAAEERVEQLNAEYAHSARLNAMGEMATAIAHELNQPLAAIGNFLGAAEQTLVQSEGNPTVVEMLGKANIQVTRTGEIIRRLRDFMAKRDGELQVEDLSHVVDDAVAIAFVGQDQVQAHFDIPPDTRIIADRVQVQQVLVNLLRNAAEAMRDLPADRRVVTVTAHATDDSMVEVSVADRGNGFARKVLSNMYAPFLSTKSGRGMGVGLSISRRIIEAHGGRFVARNGPDGGAIISFTLPFYGGESEGAE